MIPIYLDHAATTYPSKKTQKLFSKLEENHWANASSIHTAGTNAAKLLEQSRKDFAEIIFARAKDCVFTRGGTEAITLPIQAILREWKKQKPNVIPAVYISPLEHSAIKEYVTQLDDDGLIDGYVLDINAKGQIDQKALLKNLNKKTALVSVQMVNNEIGLTQDIIKISKTVRGFKKNEYGERTAQWPMIHVDAAQAWGWINPIKLDTRKLGIDALSFGSSKWGGSKSVGIAWLKPAFPKNGLWFNGSHEMEMRPGTVDVPAVVSSVFAAKERLQKRQQKLLRIKKLRQWFVLNLKESFGKGIQINSGIVLKNKEELFVSSIVSVSFAKVSGERMTIELNAQNIYVGFGAACNTISGSASHVLDALGLLDAPFDLGAVRFSFEFSTTKDQLQKSLAALEHIYKKVQFEQKTGSDVIL